VIERFIECDDPHHVDQADLGTPTGMPSVEPRASILLLLSRAEDYRSGVFSDEQDLFSFGSQHKSKWLTPRTVEIIMADRCNQGVR